MKLPDRRSSAHEYIMDFALISIKSREAAGRGDEAAYFKSRRDIRAAIILMNTIHSAVEFELDAHGCSGGMIVDRCIAYYEKNTTKESK